MQRIKFLLLALVATLSLGVSAQNTDANVFGDVKSDGEHIPFANVYVKGTNRGISTDESGHYMLIDLPLGKHTLVAKFIGYKDQEKEIEAVAGETIMVNFELKKAN